MSNNSPINSARSLLNDMSFGVLSTHSKKLEGYPFGSLTPYCLDGMGRPVVLISALAEHTQNISNNKRVALTISKAKAPVQTNPRISIIGNMEALPETEQAVQERYFRHFPDSRMYFEALDFSFFRLQPVQVRFIKGFGAIHWLEVSEFLSPNPFQDNGEIRILEHMNEDHEKDLIKYCEYYKDRPIGPEDQIRMVGIDGFGFDVFVNAQKIRFDLKQPISNAKEAREALVALSQGAS